jgi:hypothetical protein
VVIVGPSLIVGCEQGPPRVAVPSWKPQQIANRVLDQLDADRDSFIDASEAKVAPGLAAAFGRIDANQDKRLTESEIRERFQLYEKLRTGLVARSFQVLLNGRPLAGAQVSFVPEDFQGGVIETASGVTDITGVVVPQTAGQDMPAMQVGFYRVEVNPGQGTPGQTPSIKSPVGVEVSPISESDESGTPILRIEG